MRDLLSEAINRPAGKLAEILLRRFEKGPDGQEIAPEIQERLDRLVRAPGKFGALARVCFARAVAFLFDRAPQWTSVNIVPLFDWNSPEAADAWEARKYGHIGSPALFAQTKPYFLKLFERKDLEPDELRIFADWMTIILITNQVRGEEFYPLKGDEARIAARRAGEEALPNIGHRLAITLQSVKPEEKASYWRNVIAPVFNAVWPLDIDLQSYKSTFKLVQILTSSGAAFSDAADVIIPFIRPDDPRAGSTLFALSQAPQALYEVAPKKFLELVSAVVGETASSGAWYLGQTLEKLRNADPSIVEHKKYQRLLSLSRPT